MPFCTQCGGETQTTDDGHQACAKGHMDYTNPAPTVGVAILRGTQVLLAQRAHPPKEGEWDLIGGFVEVNESAEQAIARELLEETSMTLTSAELVQVAPGDYDGRPTLNLLYIGQAAGEPEARDDVADLQWFDLDALPSPLAWPHEVAMLERLATMVQRIQSGDPNPAA